MRKFLIFLLKKLIGKDKIIKELKSSLKQHKFTRTQEIHLNGSSQVFIVDAIHYTKDLEPILIVKKLNGQRVFAVSYEDAKKYQEYKGIIS